MDIGHHNWTYEEFSATPPLMPKSTRTKEALIQQRLGEHSYRRVKAVYEECSDLECINMILSCQEKFMTDKAGRQRMVSGFKQVFQAGHRYTAMEQERVRLLEPMI